MKFWRITQIITVIFAILSFSLLVGLTTYFHDSRAAVPDSINHRIYAEIEQGRVVYLNKIEHYFVRFLSPFGFSCFVFAAWIQRKKINSK